MVQAFIALCLMVFAYGVVVGVAYALSVLFPAAWNQGLDKVALITVPVAAAVLVWQLGYPFLIPVLLSVAAYKAAVEASAWWWSLPR